LTKTPLDYRPESGENRKLRDTLIQHFDLGEIDIQGQIPVPINKVIEPIFDACRKYIRAYAKAHNMQMEPTHAGC
jgi:hypothetical protein